MSVVEYKKISHGGTKYLVSRIEYSDRIEYRAWERAQPSNSESGFLSNAAHRTTYQAGGELWGDISTRCPSAATSLMTPLSERRVIAEAEEMLKAKNLAHILIRSVFDVVCGEDAGCLIIKRDAPVKLDEPKQKDEGRQSAKYKTDDPVRNMLAVVPFEKLKELAKLNSVPVKLSDTAGLLKMRVMNAFRAKIKKGEAIKEI